MKATPMRSSSSLLVTRTSCNKESSSINLDLDVDALLFLRFLVIHPKPSVLFQEADREERVEACRGIDLESFFKQHEKNFASFGGDTQKLGYFSKITYADFVFESAYADALEGRETKLDNIITKEMLQLALKELDTNDSLRENDHMYRHMYS